MQLNAPFPPHKLRLICWCRFLPADLQSLQSHSMHSNGMQEAQLQAAICSLLLACMPAAAQGVTHRLAKCLGRCSQD